MVNFPQYGAKSDIATLDVKEEDLKIIPVMHAIINEQIKAQFEALGKGPEILRSQVLLSAPILQLVEMHAARPARGAFHARRQCPEQGSRAKRRGSSGSLAGDGADRKTRVTFHRSSAAERQRPAVRRLGTDG